MQGQKSLWAILIFCLPQKILGSNNDDHNSYSYIDTSFRLLALHGSQTDSTSVIPLEPNSNAVGSVLFPHFTHRREENAYLAQQGLTSRFLTPSPGLLAPIVPPPPIRTPRPLCCPRKGRSIISRQPSLQGVLPCKLATLGHRNSSFYRNCHWAGQTSPHLAGKNQ